MEYGQETLDLVANIMANGVEHVALFMRHSARTYHPGIPDFENQLTDEGRVLARDLGGALPKEVTIRGYSSPVNRCVETADFILEGHKVGGGEITRRRQIEALGNAHILDMNRVARVVQDIGIETLYSKWFRQNWIAICSCLQRSSLRLRPTSYWISSGGHSVARNWIFWYPTT